MVMETMFENAQFGDMYCTRCGIKAVFIHRHRTIKHIFLLMLDDLSNEALPFLESGHYRWGYNGKNQHPIPVEEREEGSLDIIGKWGDPSNQEKIDYYNKHLLDFIKN